MPLPSPSTVQLPAHLLPASDVNVPAAPQEPVGILQEGQVPFPGIRLLALSLSPLATMVGPFVLLFPRLRTRGCNLLTGP